MCLLLFINLWPYLWVYLKKKKLDIAFSHIMFMKVLESKTHRGWHLNYKDPRAGWQMCPVPGQTRTPLRGARQSQLHTLMPHPQAIIRSKLLLMQHLTSHLPLSIPRSSQPNHIPFHNYPTSCKIPQKIPSGRPLMIPYMYLAFSQPFPLYV